MDRYNYYYERLLSNTDLGNLQDAIEQADLSRTKEALGYWVASGLTLTESDNLVGTLTTGTAYYVNGNRIYISDSVSIDTLC